jgi:hypothetical protein
MELMKLFAVDRGKYEKAEQMHRNALEAREKALKAISSAWPVMPSKSTSTQHSRSTSQ